MKKNFKSTIKCLLVSLCLAGVGAFMFASMGYAAGILQSEAYHTSSGDNSAATIAATGMKWAEHDTTQWQELWDDSVDGKYGVSWSTDGTNFGHCDQLYVGQTVTFKFNMHSENVGNHYANILKGWIDWGTNDSNYQFTDDEEVVFGSKKLWLSNPRNTSYNWYSAPINKSLGDEDPSTYDFESSYGVNYRDGYNFGDDDVAYYYTLTLDKTNLGTAYLRARVTCSDSLGTSVMGTEYGWANQWTISDDEYQTAFNSYDDYGQGEIEDWKFTVFGDPGNPGSAVPEPTTLALFGMGLIGLARVGRKKA